MPGTPANMRRFFPCNPRVHVVHLGSLPPSGLEATAGSMPRAAVHFFHNFNPLHTWAMTLDLDEYIALRGFAGLKDFARRTLSREVPGAALQWLIVRV
jgi:hypothetical protein